MFKIIKMLKMLKILKCLKQIRLWFLNKIDFRISNAGNHVEIIEN